MPLSINVGLSRKASKDYQSTGVSINVTAELDQSLLAKPEELQRQIDDLYSQAASALERNAAEPEPPQPTPTNPRDARPRPAGRVGRVGRVWRVGNGYSTNGPGDRSHGGNGHGNGNGNGHGRSGTGPVSMTQSQRRAIDSISARLGIDPYREAQDIIGVELDQLSIRQASELIDHLKSQQPADNGR